MMWFTTREEPLTGLAREVSRSSLTSDHHDDGGRFGGLKASLEEPSISGGDNGDNGGNNHYLKLCRPSSECPSSLTCWPFHVPATMLAETPGSAGRLCFDRYKSS